MKDIPAKRRWLELSAAVIQLGKNQRILEARVKMLESAQPIQTIGYHTTASAEESNRPNSNGH